MAGKVSGSIPIRRRERTFTQVSSPVFLQCRANLVDFHCQSTKEDKICLADECPANLELFRRSALARRRYDDLAHRPFNRLFLPEEHR